MDEDESHSTGENKVHDHDTPAKPDAKTIDYVPNDFSPWNQKPSAKAKTPIVVEIVIAGCATCGLWLLGEWFVSHDYKVLGGIVDYLACVSFFAVVPLAILNRWDNPKVVWSCFALFCCVLGWAFIVSSRPKLREISLPLAEIKTQLGLRGPMPGGEITAEMSQMYREQTFIIKNPNNIDLRNLAARVQLPEPAVIEAPPSIGPIGCSAPPGVHVRWIPEPSGWVSQSSGAGAGVKFIGKRISKSEWMLDIDSLPAFTEIQIPFLTISWTNSPMPLGLTDQNSHTLINFLDGSFQFPGSDGWRTQEIVMPILFDQTNRIFHSLPLSKRTGFWTNVYHREFGF
jgi:hypothetical protein